MKQGSIIDHPTFGRCVVVQVHNIFCDIKLANGLFRTVSKFQCRVVKV